MRHLVCGPRATGWEATMRALRSAAWLCHRSSAAPVPPPPQAPLSPSPQTSPPRKPQHPPPTLLLNPSRPLAPASGAGARLHDGGAERRLHLLCDPRRPLGRPSAAAAAVTPHLLLRSAARVGEGHGRDEGQVGGTPQPAASAPSHTPQPPPPDRSLSHGHARSHAHTPPPSPPPPPPLPSPPSHLSPLPRAATQAGSPAQKKIALAAKAIGLARNLGLIESGGRSSQQSCVDTLKCAAAARLPPPSSPRSSSSCADSPTDCAQAGPPSPLPLPPPPPPLTLPPALLPHRPISLDVSCRLWSPTSCRARPTTPHPSL